jgi:hypothetical protein
MDGGPRSVGVSEKPVQPIGIRLDEVQFLVTREVAVDRVDDECRRPARADLDDALRIRPPHLPWRIRPSAIVK